MKIRQKLLVSILTAVAVILAITNYLTFTESREIVLAKMKNAGEVSLLATEARVRNVIESVEHVASDQAIALESLGTSDLAKIRALLQRALVSEPFALGSAVAFVPDGFPGGASLVAPSYRRSAAGIVYRNLADQQNFDYVTQPWFREAVEGGKPVWTEPRLDEVEGKQRIMTYAYPFKRDGKV